MARLVIRNKDKTHSDKATKRGMVIDVLQDGQGLGSSGEIYPEWTVVEVDAPVEELVKAFLVPGEQGQRRAFRFNLDEYAGGVLTLQQALAMRRK